MPGLKFNEERAMIAFADKLIVDKGITGLTNDQRGRLRRNLVDEMSNRLEEAVIMSLPDDKIIELEKLLDGEVTEEQVDTLLDGSGVDFKAVYMRGLKDFRDSYLAGEIEVPIPAAREPKKKTENSGAKEQIVTAQNGAMTSNEQNNNAQNAAPQVGSLENALKQAQAGMAQAVEQAEVPAAVTAPVVPTVEKPTATTAQGPQTVPVVSAAGVDAVNDANVVNNINGAGSANTTNTMNAITGEGM